MSNIIITYDQLHATATHLRNQANTVTGILQGLSNQVQSMEGGFKGAAHDAYNQYFTEWQQAATKLNHALEGLSELTTRVANEFQQADGQIANWFQNR